MSPRLWLLALLATTACQSPLRFSFDIPPEIATVLLVSKGEDGLAADAFVGGEQLSFTLPADATEFLALGYLTSLDRLGLTTGRVPLRTRDEPGQSLPIATRSWIRQDESMIAIEWAAIDPTIKELRLPLASGQTCFEGGGCYRAGDTERFCVPCPEQASPIMPVRPAPARLPPCELGTDAERFACLFAGRALEVASSCAGLNLPSGCLDEAECRRHPESGAMIWVPPAADVPVGDATALTLDEALAAIPENGVIMLGNATFSASVPVPAGVKLSGLCARDTIVTGDLIVSTATLAHLAWRGATQIPLGSTVDVAEAEIQSAAIAIAGTLRAQATRMIAPIELTGTLTLQSAVVEDDISARGHFEGRDLRFTPVATLSIFTGGNAELLLTRFDAHPSALVSAVEIDDGALHAEQSAFMRTIMVSTTTDTQSLLDLVDSFIGFEDDTSASAIHADTHRPSGFVEDGSYCPVTFGAALTLRRLTVSARNPGTSFEPPSVDSIRVNCASLVAEDLMVNGHMSGAGLHLGMLGDGLDGPRVSRAMVTAYGILDQDRVDELREMHQSYPTSPAFRLAEALPFRSGPSAVTMTLSDLTAFARKRAFHIRAGRQRVNLERFQAIGSYGAAMMIQRFSGEVQMRDIELYKASVVGNDGTHFGNGLVLFFDVGDMAATYAFDRFAFHGLTGAAIHLTGALGTLELSHGTVSDNQFGIIDALGTERDRFTLTEVLFRDNAVTFESN